MSQWNHPLYNLGQKLFVVAIVAALILAYSAAVGSPITPFAASFAVFSAALSVAIAFGLRRVGGEPA